MKWWSILLVILIAMGCGVGGFFVADVLQSSKAEVPKAGASKEEVAAEAPPSDAKSDKESTAPQPKVIAPTLPRMHKHLKSVKNNPSVLSRYHNTTAPTLSGQTAYGPPADVYNQMFTQDILLPEQGQEIANIKGFAKYQVEFGVFDTYAHALSRKQSILQKVSVAIHIVDIKKGGKVMYSLRTRRPMSKAEAQTFMLHLIERADIVSKVVSYVF